MVGDVSSGDGDLRSDESSTASKARRREIWRSWAVDAAAAAAARARRAHFATAGVLFGFIGGVFYYCTRAVQQGEISEAEVEAFKRERDEKRQLEQQQQQQR